MLQLPDDLLWLWFWCTLAYWTSGAHQFRASICQNLDVITWTLMVTKERIPYLLVQRRRTGTYDLTTETYLGIEVFRISPAITRYFSTSETRSMYTGSKTKYSTVFVAIVHISMQGRTFRGGAHMNHHLASLKRPTQKTQATFGAYINMRHVVSSSLTSS